MTTTVGLMLAGSAALELGDAGAAGVHATTNTQLANKRRSMTVLLSLPARGNDLSTIAMRVYGPRSER